MAYLGGVRMGALTISTSKEVFVLAVALEWGIAFPLLLWVSETLHLSHTQQEVKTASLA